MSTIWVRLADSRGRTGGMRGGLIESLLRSALIESFFFEFCESDVLARLSVPCTLGVFAVTSDIDGFRVDTTTSAYATARWLAGRCVWRSTRQLQILLLHCS